MISYSLSSVVLAHGLDISGSSGIWLLIIMSLFVFGLLLCRKVVKIPKGLFISSFISYVLLLINILILSFRSQIPIEVGLPFVMVGILPSYLILIYTGGSLEWLFGSGFCDMLDWTIVLFLIAFIINTLCIFAIIRLILYIKRKVSAKKPQVKQAV